ncbi:MAG: hypothetical protein KJT03_04560, partial [Verrucomicrobiae bacterium]|nr:hypothetical protein [Verrucomicrobiae bacterium]
SGQPASPVQVASIFEGSEVGEEAWESMHGNLQRNEVDLEQEPLTLGSWMSLAKSGEELLVENPECAPVANYLFQPRNYRAPFIVPNTG